MDKKLRVFSFTMILALGFFGLGFSACVKHVPKPVMVKAPGEPGAPGGNYPSAPTPSVPAPSTPAASGTETSGGGSFLEAMFRETAKRAHQEMSLRHQVHPKTQEFIKTLEPLIENEDAVVIVISKDPLQ